jgi:hypothetical protein
MKNRSVCVFLAALAFSGGVWAQDSDREFFTSISLVYTISTGETRGNATRPISQSVGITANFFVFSHENFGYYISPGIGIRMRYNTEIPNRMDMYFGTVLGPAFRIYSGSEVDIFAGLGPDISFMLRLDDFEDGSFESTETFLGLDLGGCFEARLKLNNDIAFTGGILMRNVAAGPYIGIGF